MIFLRLSQTFSGPGKNNKKGKGAFADLSERALHMPALVAYKNLFCLFFHFRFPNAK